MKQRLETVCNVGQPIVEYQPGVSFAVAELNQHSPTAGSAFPQLISGAVTGVLAGFSDSGAPLVDFADNKTNRPLIARATLAVTETDVGQDVLLLFEGGDLAQPIIIGRIQSAHQPEAKKPIDIKLDGEQLIFTAEREIVLRCGKSSITLTKAGKVLIRGEYLLSRASGENRIKGGSVQIN